MDPARLIPAAEAIPSPWGWFEALLWLTFVLHLVFMNLAVGSAALALFSRSQRELARELGHRIPTFLALTVNFGVPPLLFVQVLYGQFLYTSSVLMAGWWLSAIAAVIAGYYGAYVHDARFESAPGLARLALVASLCLLAYTGFLLANNMTFMLRPEAWQAYFRNPNGTLLNTADPTMWSRTVHILLAAPAVAGLFVALLGERRNRPEWTGLGLAWFTRVTMLEIAVGVWVLMSLPREVMLGFMGGDGLATALLSLSVLAGLAALYAGIQKKPAAAAWLTLAAIALMAATRAKLRLLTLAPFFSPGSLPVTNEVTPLAMFVVALAVGLVVIAWMLKTFAKYGAKTEGRG
jgi:hypothetical protein